MKIIHKIKKIVVGMWVKRKKKYKRLIRRFKQIISYVNVKKTLFYAQHCQKYNIIVYVKQIHNNV